MAESEMMTVREVATYLRISLPSAYKLIHYGELPHVNIGERIIVPKDVLMLWLSSRIAGGDAHAR